MDFSNLFNRPVQMPHDDNGAHDEVKRIMQKGEDLSTNFGTDKDKYPYVWIESDSTRGFKYRVSQPGLTWVINYLVKGETDDHGVNPTAVEPFNEGEGNNFQLQIFKQLVESGKQMQFVPQFRETSGKISATARFKKGTIFFRLERTDDLVEYLQEKGQM